MVFLVLRQEPGIHSRVTAGVAINNFCFFTDFRTPLYSDGHLRSLNQAWQNNTDTSGVQAGDQVSLSSWHSDIGLPIHFQEESVIVTL